jgi:hypothetical protein
MLSLTSSTFRDVNVLARRDLGAGPTSGTFHQIGHPAIYHFHQQGTACRAGVNQIPYHSSVDGADKTPASTSTHFRPSPHHASTPPYHQNSVQQSDQVTLLLQPTLFLEFTRPLRPAVTTSTFPNQFQQHRHHAPTPCDHHPAHRRRCGAVRAQPPAQALGAAASSAAGFFAVNHRVREHQGASSLRSHEEQERAHHGWEWTR